MSKINNDPLGENSPNLVTLRADLPTRLETTTKRMLLEKGSIPNQKVNSSTGCEL
jgi:hypothetical protein